MLRIILLSLSLVFVMTGYTQDTGANLKKAKSLLLGGNYREGIHGGFTIGNQVKSGLNFGYFPDLNSLTLSGTIKLHLKGSSRFYSYSPWNLRLNPGLQLDFANNTTEVKFPYLAGTFGRDFYITKKFGFSGEVGFMYFFDFIEGYFPINSEWAPAGGLKFFRMF